MNQLRKLAFNMAARRYSTVVEHLNDNVKVDLNKIGKERCLNMVQLIGRVGQDPKVTSVDKAVSEDVEGDGKRAKVVLFSLATNEYQVKPAKSGELDRDVKPRVDWHRIAVFAPKLQENVEKFVRQGDRVHVTGRLHYNLVRDKSGDQRYVSSIIADDIIFLTKYN